MDGTYWSWYIEKMLNGLKLSKLEKKSTGGTNKSSAAECLSCYGNC